MLNYETHVGKGSMFNTPPVYPIFVSYLTLKWLKALGGVEVMAERNSAKANLLYGEIDRNSCFKGTVATEDRSKMNVSFLLNDNSKDQLFLDMCEKEGIMGNKGHRSVGGFRASTYNAMPIESVEVLVNAMKAFEVQHA